MEYRKQENGKIISWDMFVEKHIGAMPDLGVLGFSFDLLEKVEVEYDSTAETLKHIKKVNNYLIDASTEILKRAKVHDNSKLEDPEKMTFDEMTPLLASLKFGSPEYTESTKKMKPALDHHYKVNSHHPQYVYRNEKWKSVENYNGLYEISSEGRVKRLYSKGERILKPNLTPKGYCRLQLTKNNESSNHFIHTLVAQSFIGKKPSDRHQVNHINGDKTDNRKENLEWVTPSENVKHAYENDLIESNVKHVVFCKEKDILTFGIEKMVYELRKIGYDKISSGGIWRCIHSEGEATHYDLHFESYNIDEYKELQSPINDMNIFDILEMFFDWKAAGERTKDGDIHKSIEINAGRFGLSKQLKSIFENTANYLWTSTST